MRGQYSVLARFSVALVLICIAGTAAAQSGGGVAQIAALLRAAPADEALLTRTLDRLLATGQVDDCVTALTDADADGASLHVAGRLLESAGRTADAFLVYERAHERDDTLGITRTRWVHQLLDAGWVERAREVHAEGVDGSKAAVEELRYRSLVHAGQGGETLLLALSDIPIAERTAWALREEQWATAAALSAEAGDTANEIEFWIRAGNIRLAVLRWRETPQPAGERDALALRLARISGSPSILEKYLGARDDTIARRLRAELAASLGKSAASASPESSNATPEQPAAPNSGTPNSGKPERGDTPPADGSDRSAADSAASSVVERIVAGSRAAADVAAAKALASPTVPRAVALLTLGLEAEARREFALCRLTGSDHGEERWLRHLQGVAPHWLPEPVLAPAAALDQAESWQAQRRDPEKATVTAHLHRALLEVTAGTALEAQLLFHRGRLTRSHADLLRAARIAPAAPVAVQLRRQRRVEPIARAADREMGVDVGAELQLARPLPSLDTPLGRDGEQGLTLARYPYEMTTIPGDWYVSDWWDVPPMDTPAPLTSARAAAIAPLTGHLTVPGVGTLFFGNGIVLELADGGWLRLERRGAMRASGPNHSAVRSLPAAVRTYLSAFRPAAIPGWQDQAEFLDAVARRNHLVSLEPVSMIAATLYDPATQTVLVRTHTGECARLTPAPPRPRPPVSYPGYTQTSPGFYVAADQAESPPTRLPGFTSQLQLIESAKTAIPDRDHPEIEPILARSAPRLPASLSDVAIVCDTGGPHRVLVLADGHVCYEGPGSRWIARIEVALPGAHALRAASAHNIVRHASPDGSPPGATRAVTTAGTLRATRQLPGPTPGGSTPRVVISDEGFFVLTDTVSRFSWAGPHSTHQIPSDERLRDAASHGDDSYVLTTHSLREFTGNRSRKLPAPRHAFDIAVVGAHVYVLCLRLHSGDQFELWRCAIGADADSQSGRRPFARLQRCALPQLPWEGDRASLLLTRLAAWDDHLLLLHDDLYAASAGAAGTAETGVTGDHPLTWKTLLRWKEHDPFLFAVYWQTPPRLTPRGLAISRPWGVVEVWGPGGSDRDRVK